MSVAKIYKRPLKKYKTGGTVESFDTALSPEELKSYNTFAQQYANVKGLRNVSDASKDYDLQGWYKANQTNLPELNSNIHFKDTWKKPNHITFSDQSMYSTPEHAGGKWLNENENETGAWSYLPSEHNLKTTPSDRYQEYFKNYEPNSTLLLPETGVDNMAKKPMTNTIKSMKCGGTVKKLKIGGTVPITNPVDTQNPDVQNMQQQEVPPMQGNSNEQLQVPQAQGGQTPNVEAEGGEVVQTPNGQSQELNGPSHENGGIDLALPEGSHVFSDTLGVKDEKGDFKTMAERKLERTAKISRIAKYVDKHKDPFAKNTVLRTIGNLDKEEQSDLRLQDGYNKYTGSGEYANDGKVTAADGITDFSGGGMPAGTMLGLASQLTGGIGNIINANNYTANRPQMQNPFKDYGLNALTKLNSLNYNVDRIKQNNINMIDRVLQQKNNDMNAHITDAGGSKNLQRAQRANAYNGMTDAYANMYSKTNSEADGQKLGIGEKMATMSAERDKMVGTGYEAQYKDQIAGYDESFNARSKNISDMSAGISNIGTQMNKNLFNNRYLAIEGERWKHNVNAPNVSNNAYGTGILAPDFTSLDSEYNTY